MQPAGPDLLFSVRELDAVKAAVATLGTAWLLAGIWLRRRPSPAARLRRSWDVGLALLGLAGALCWTNLLQFNFPGFGHPSETFHYYVGAKYFRELGYERLYHCTALADAEALGEEQVARRRLRDLRSNELVSATRALEDPEACRAHFTPERWQAFVHDVAWFRAQVPARRWLLSQMDHGYNGTPAWGLFGGLLASLTSVLINLSVPLLTSRIIDDGITPGDSGLVVRTALLMVALIVLGMGASAFASVMARSAILLE